MMEESYAKQCSLEMFNRFDKNKDGYLDSEDVTAFVKHSYSKKGKDFDLISDDFFKDKAEKLICKIDCNGDGKISREDFYYFYKKA